MERKYEFLSGEQVKQFLEQGYIVLHDCFSRELAEEWTARAFARLGYDPEDPKSWKQTRVHMPTATRVPIKEFAPKAWGAACELLGGEARVRPSCLREKWPRSVPDDPLCNGA